MHHTVPTSRIGTALSAALLAMVALLASQSAAAETDAKGFVRVAPDQVAWRTINPQGVKNVVLYGDPSKPGLYIVRNTFPPGIMSAPHSHSEDRIIAVIKGTWYTGTDDAWDVDATKPMSPGSYMIHPANAVHFDGAKDEEVIVQITGMGPVKTVYTAPAEGGFGKPHKLK